MDILSNYVVLFEIIKNLDVDNKFKAMSVKTMETSGWEMPEAAGQLVSLEPNHMSGRRYQIHTCLIQNYRNRLKTVQVPYMGMLSSNMSRLEVINVKFGLAFDPTLNQILRR